MKPTQPFEGGIEGLVDCLYNGLMVGSGTQARRNDRSYVTILDWRDNYNPTCSKSVSEDRIDTEGYTTD